MNIMSRYKLRYYKPIDIDEVIEHLTNHKPLSGTAHSPKLSRLSKNFSKDKPQINFSENTMKKIELLNLHKE